MKNRKVNWMQWEGDTVCRKTCIVKKDDIPKKSKKFKEEKTTYEALYRHGFAKREDYAGIINDLN